MSEEKKDSGLHIHLGGLVIVIIILLLIFKVDFKKNIDSPQFQKNVSYLEEKSKNIWDKYLSKPFVNTWNRIFSSIIDKGTEELKNSIMKPTNEENVN
jgi:hypothetical protein